MLGIYGPGGFGRELAAFARRDREVLFVSDAATRCRLANKCTVVGSPFGALASTSHKLGDNVVVGDGSVFRGQAVCTSELKVGRCFHTNTFSRVAHECSIADFFIIAARVCIDSNTIDEDEVYISTGAILRQGASPSPEAY